MKSNILIEGVSCNVLYLFYEKKVMQTGLGRKNWRGGFREYYFGIPIENVINGIIAICQSSDVTIPSTTANEVGKYGKKTSI